MHSLLARCCFPHALVTIVASGASGLTAQVTNYNGIWLLTAPVIGSGFCINVDRIEITAQYPSISCRIAYGANPLYGPLTGSFTAVNQASAILYNTGECGVRSDSLTLTFTGPNQCQGTFSHSEMAGCICPAFTGQFTAQRNVSSYSAFAAGCYGASGQTQIMVTVPPSITNGLQFDLIGVPAGVAVVLTGLSSTHSGTTSLPLDLGPYGMPSCSLWVSPDCARWVTGGANIHVQYAIPNAASLVGMTFYQQAWSPAPGANPLGGVMSTACVGVIGA
jgi:hypothetical protein